MTVKKDFPYGDHCAIIIQIDGKSKKTDKGEILMKHVKTLNTRKLQNTIKTGGCGAVLLAGWRGAVPDFLRDRDGQGVLVQGIIPSFRNAG